MVKKIKGLILKRMAKVWLYIFKTILTYMYFYFCMQKHFIMDLEERILFSTFSVSTLLLLVNIVCQNTLFPF